MYKMGFIGLGVMGWPMAGHLKKNGHDVTVYNRSSQKAESWLKKFKGKIVSTPKEASLGVETVLPLNFFNQEAAFCELRL